MLLMIIIIYGITFIIDFLPLAHQKSKWGMGVFLFFFIIGLTIPILEQIGIDIPSPFFMLCEFFKSIGLAYPA